MSGSTALSALLASPSKESPSAAALHPSATEQSSSYDNSWNSSGHTSEQARSTENVPDASDDSNDHKLSSCSRLLAAPAFSVSAINPGRMETLRVLLLEGKHAAAEGRLAAALRKYETAMVTLPEAYKPRLRSKIAKLEAQLDDEEERTPARPSRKAQGFSRVAESDLDPSSLLQIAVNECSTIAAANAAGRVNGALSSDSSSQTPSPLVSGLRTYKPRATFQSDDNGKVGFVYNSQHASSHTLTQGGAIRPTGRLQTVPFPMEMGSERTEGPMSDEKGSFGTSFCKDHCSVDGEESATENNQEQRRLFIKDLSDKLEKQVVEVMNEVPSDKLMELHGIGARRAELIVQERAAAPFKTMSDLTRIGMYPKQIERMGKYNMLECLDVFPFRNPEEKP